MDRKRITLRNTAAGVQLMLLVVLAVANPTLIEAQTPTIRYTTADTSACDITGTLTQKFALSGIPSGYTNLYIDLEDEADKGSTRYQKPLVELINNECELSVVKTSYGVDRATGHSIYTFKIRRARISNSVSEADWIDLEILEPSTLTWNIYGTPSVDEALVAADDPCCIKIMNNSQECGYDLTLRANSAWAGVSHYEWTSTSDRFSIDAEGPTSELRQIRSADGKGSIEPLSTVITMRQTVGGMCSSVVSKEITMMGYPEATLLLDEARFGQSVDICTSLAADDDPNRLFNGTIELVGEEPFEVELTTGDKYTGLVSGANAFDRATATTAARVTMVRVTDRNGCYAPEEMKHGGIDVRDRRPHPSFRTDSLHSEARDIEVEVIPTDRRHSFEWGVMPRFEGIDTHVEGYDYEALVKSNMNSTVDYYVIETDENGVRCNSDSTVLTIGFEMPLRYPNAFSPNGDGRNDRLVIEGLPEQNRITVVDSRGKKVYEKENYRNDWAADDVEDGYYIYIFKGEGTKTVKETLAIKRTMK